MIKNKTFVIIFIIYMFTLIYITLFYNREVYLSDNTKAFNLELFTTIKGYWYNGFGNIYITLKNLFANLLMFVPFSFLLPVINKKFNFVITLVLALGLSTLIEFIQYYTNRGSADIDDIVMNLFSAFLGYILFKILEFQFNINGYAKKQD